jgi:hypothetical protein
VPGAVNNEDHFVLDVTKGLWNTGSVGGNDVPPGYCKTLDNMVADGNRLRLRPSFSTVSDWRNNIPATTGSPNLEMPAYYNVYEPSKRMWPVGGGPNQPNLIWQAARGTNTAYLGTFLSDDVGNAPKSAHGNSDYVRYSASGFIFYGFTQFPAAPTLPAGSPPQIYGATLAATNGIKRLINWTPTNTGNGIGAVTVQDVIGSPPSRGLVYFRDRFFAWNKDVLYWTDLAITTANGMPETWNMPQNFTRVPSNIANVKIQEVMVFNDRLIIFTNAGLFSLKTMGDPKTDWAWNTIDENIKVQAQVQCTQMRGTIYYADDMGVWSYNGDSFSLVSAAISNYFDLRYDVQHIDSPVYNIYPVHDGLLLTIKTPKSVFSGGLWRWDVSGVEMLYYNIKWNSWCRWSVHFDFQLEDIMGASSDSRTTVHGGNVTNWIMMRMSPMTSNTQVYEIDFSGFSGELYDSNDSKPAFGGSNRAIFAEIESASFDVGTPHRLKALKYAFLDTCHHTGAVATLGYSWDVEGTEIVGDLVTIEADAVTGAEFFKIAGGFKFREAVLHLQYQGNDYVEIKPIHVVNEVERVELRSFPGEIP